MRNKMFAKIINEGEPLGAEGIAATIGFFDGVHLGHRALIERTREEAKKDNLPVAIITFDCHPREVLHTDFTPQLLMSKKERLSALATSGADFVIVLHFTPELARMSAEEFLSVVLAKRYNVRELVVGYDHRFGHNRADGFEQYVAYGEKCGIRVVHAEPEEFDGVRVSSSYIRRLISGGDVWRAAYFMGNPYRLEGIIVKGYQVGRRIGFPTANIQVRNARKLIPANGVYAVFLMAGLRELKGMLYIGSRPTLDDGGDVSIEVNIFDFSGDLYGETVTVYFYRRLREDIRFGTLGELQEQLRKDEDDVKKLLG